MLDPLSFGEYVDCFEMYLFKDRKITNRKAVHVTDPQYVHRIIFWLYFSIEFIVLFNK